MDRREDAQDDATLRSVLVVEDDPHIRRLIATVLDDAGYRCGEAGDTPTAGVLLTERPFDVLVCDINLPGETGVEFVRRIRPQHRDLAVLMVTAVDDPAIAAAALESGADGYITKPFRPNDIVIGVLNVLRHRSAARDHAAERTRLEQASLRDPLTGLPQRPLVPRVLADVCERAESSGADVCLAVVDLDRFSLVNGALGPEAGDSVLREVVARLQEVSADGSNIVRLGPDEFLVLEVQPAQAPPGRSLPERIVAALADPVEVGDRAISMTASVGVAVASEGARRSETVLQHAEIALRRAKETGGNRVCRFQPALLERRTQRLTAEMQLRRAVEQEQFLLYYQPIVDLEHGRLNGLEALLRWNHPEEGIVAPGRFIPVAEETGLIVELGAWVIEEACRQAGQWAALAGRCEPGRISVNVSPRQFAEPGFIAAVGEVFRRTGVEPSRLAFEITESQLMDGAVATRSLEAARELGIELVLDDFGTGYSSLGHLKQLPIQALKIDRLFVGPLPGDASNLALIHAILAMADSLGIEVVAEGIETPEQAHLLRSIECRGGQGYLLGRPMPAAAATTLLREEVDWVDLLSSSEPGESPTTTFEYHGTTGRLQASPGPRTRTANAEGAQRLLRPAEAAAELGVSLSTLRRWADTGQIPMVRTEGGHRRFDADDVRVFKHHARADPPAIHATRPPGHPLPSLARLLDEDADALLEACTGHLVAGSPAGDRILSQMRPQVSEWLATLARSCESGDYGVALSGARTLMRHAYLDGASLLEGHRCIDALRDGVVARLMRRHAPRHELVAVRRLFAALGQSLLQE